MRRTENFGFRLSPQEKTILRLVAEQEEREPSDMLRVLIRKAAREHGLEIDNQTVPDRVGRTVAALSG